jgi:DNA-binding XRE family transcriptional regulator
MQYLSRTHEAFCLLENLGFSKPNIRRALFSLNGMNQRMVADQLGVHPNTVAMTVTGKRCSWPMLLSLARIFEVPVDILFDDNDGVSKRHVRQGS